VRLLIFGTPLLVEGLVVCDLNLVSAFIFGNVPILYLFHAYLCFLSSEE
jgi:hypothetical protein